MAKGNMTVKTGRTGNTIKSLEKKKQSLSAKIQGIESTPERDSLLHEIDLVNLEIDYRKDNEMESSVLEKYKPEARRQILDINKELLENSKSSENLSYLDRKLSKEQDNLREKRTDLRFEIGEIDEADSGRATKMQELNRLESEIENLTRKMASNLQRRRDLSAQNANLREKKQKMLQDSKNRL